MRYVVRNNFFGLDETPQEQKTKNNGPVPTTTPGENGGRQLIEGVNSSSGSLVWRKRSLAEANQEDIIKTERVAAEQMYPEQILKRDHIYPVKAWDLVGSSANIEQAKILNAEETIVIDCQSPDVSTDEVALNIYDDDIWESPGAIV